MKTVTIKNYTKNPPAVVVRFIAKTVFDNLALRQQVSIKDLAHRFLLFGPTSKHGDDPDIKSFIGAVALLHEQGVIYFDVFGRPFAEQPKDVADTSYVAALARDLINKEQKNIERQYKAYASHAASLGTV
jgi:hypothetical protein